MADKDNIGLVQKEQDEQIVNDFLDGKTQVFDYDAFARLVLHELTFPKFDATFMGFRRCDILQMIEQPERFRNKILKLSDYMYLKSGYYKRLIDYFVNQIILNYTVETNINSPKAYSNPNAFQANYIKYAYQADKINLQKVGHDIFKRLYKNDVCFAFVEEDDFGLKYYFLDPMYCEINSIVDGTVFQFCINKRKLSKAKIQLFPEALRVLIDQDHSTDGRVPVPMSNSLCLKYNTDFPFPYPPFLMMIADILLVDDFKDLAKTQSVNDAYKLLTMKIPTKDGQITLDAGLLKPFLQEVLNVVKNHIGVILTPFDTETEEFTSSNADNRDNVSNAISWAFKDVGVSEALMSGATSGSELKLSITNDSGDVFRIYRHIENWIDLQMKLRKMYFANNAYTFRYRLLNMTTFNEKDMQDQVLKQAQNGLPNKFALGAVNGMSVCNVLGNSFVENTLFKDMFDGWTPLKTSYTQSGDSEDTGRPTIDDGDLSPTGEAARDNDTNDKSNRDIL